MARSRPPGGRTAYVVLVRGINVGGKKLPMADLRAACAAAGGQEVSTYIQSGNVVLTSEEPPGELAARLERCIGEASGLSVVVVVRTAAELAAVVEANPFPGEVDPTKLVVMFLQRPLRADERAAIEALDPDDHAPEEVVMADSELYLHLPEGQGRAKLSHPFLERVTGVAATARNWRTTVKLLEMVSDLT